MNEETPQKNTVSDYNLFDAIPVAVDHNLFDTMPATFTKLLTSDQNLLDSIPVAVAPTATKEIINLSIRLPRHLWKLATLDKVDTGESLNALIVRLLITHYADHS